MATLTIRSNNPDDLTQPLSVINAAYTITTNFDTALSVTVPLYTWGDYTIRSKNGYAMININPDQKEYAINLVLADLYKSGDECNVLTGGWGISGMSHPGDYSRVTFNKLGDQMHLALFVHTMGQGNSVSISPDKKIDLTPFKSLCMRCSTKDMYGYQGRLTYSELAVYQSSKVAFVNFPRDANNTIILLDISEIMGLSTVSINLNNQSKGEGAPPNQLWVYQVWLE